MWERFSFYGMRALLVLFLVSTLGIGGWDWSRENALALYGTYLALLYLTPIIGGTLADKYLGNRRAIIIGALIMTFGHVSMAVESNLVFLYLGLGLFGLWCNRNSTRRKNGLGEYCLAYFSLPVSCLG